MQMFFRRLSQAVRTGQCPHLSVSRSWPPVTRWRDQVAPLTKEQRATMVLPPSDRTFVFVCGLHRSGTTLLAQCLAEHSDASGFRNTGAIEDEGQFLQSVYPIARRYGGVGRFGFASQMHVTEESPLVTDANRRLLYAEWSRYWDLERRVLIEKSPPNLLKTRLLQAMFPKARFVIVLRHPIATSLATQKGSHTSLVSLIRHWVVCNEVMLADLTHLEHATLLRYEDLVTHADAEVGRIQEFIGLKPYRSELEPRNGLNDAYFRRWQALDRLPLGGRYRRLIEERYEERVNRFGYSLRTPGLLAGRETTFGHLLGTETFSGAGARTAQP